MMILGSAFVFAGDLPPAEDLLEFLAEWIAEDGSTIDPEMLLLDDEIPMHELQDPEFYNMDAEDEAGD